MRFRIPAGGAAGRLILVAALLGTSGCLGDSDPIDVVDTGGDVLGSWSALSFGGTPLPIQEYVQDPDRGTCLRELRGVDLVYATGGGYTWIEEVYLDCTQGTPQTVSNTFTGTYRVEGIKLFMQDSESSAEMEYTFTVSQGLLSMRSRFGSTIISSIFQKN
jgi:hypothetical protein